jgi:hypothetical protein
MDEVTIGVDPHKLSATIEVVSRHEQLLGSGRFTTDKAGYTALRAYAKTWPDRVWAVEGANGAGRALAQRLVAAGERVLDVPAKLAARVRLFDTGHNRKTDALDAHSIAIVAVRTPGLREVAPDAELEALRMLTDRRDELARLRVQTVNRLQRLLGELIPGQRKKDLSALQAKAMLATVRPRDIAGKTRRRMAAEELADLVAVDAKLKRMKAGAEGRSPRPGVEADRHPRHRSRRRRPDPRRRRRHRPVRRPQPVRLLDRHRTAGRLLRRADPAPALPRRQPPDEPRPARRGHRAAAQRHRRTRVLPTQTRRQEDPEGSTALPQATTLQRHLSTTPRRRPSRRATRRTDGRRDGPGRALRGDSRIQRGRPAPAHRHFGSATSRTRRTDATPTPARPEPPRGLGSQPSAPARRSRQGGAPHRDERP